MDIAKAVAATASNLQIIPEAGTREKVLFTACAVLRKYHYDRNQEEWKMALEPEKKDLKEVGQNMDIAKKTEGGRTVISVTGRVDTTTAPELDAGLKLEGTETLTLDLSGVPYMSSAGLRCLLTTQKTMMAGGGSMTIVGVQPAVREVLDITGVSGILTLA